MDSASLRTPGSLLAAFLVALVLTACGTSQSDRSGGSTEDTVGSEAAPEQAGDGQEGADRDTGGGEESSAVGGDVEVQERDLVHHAELTLRVEDLEEAGERAEELTTGAEGYVSRESHESPTGGVARASMTLRIPSEGYEAALAELTEMGDRSSLERSVEDVTEEIADVEGRTESAERSLETLRGYLDEAESVEEMLEVEAQIQDRQEDLEAFRARLESLENSTAYSTVELTLLPPNAPEEDIEREELPGFLESLRSGGESLLTVGRAVAAAVGWLLPFALVVAAVGAWPWMRWRARRRERRGTFRGRSVDTRASAPDAADDGTEVPGEGNGEGSGPR
ncbi:DUF4349 domain-containing protein [Nocardiopsis kunsanensis]|uniref:DUF4349 domain-containing protein n=1 Tax=Nocardiopsis kunsanensis TaxID=141693 RepID=UPI00034774DD|nr:DUF4349 domain-containing protein [Nocardiopsis kunsanensis]